MPYTDPSARAQAQARWRARNPRKQRLRDAARVEDRPFVGVDGEGGNGPDGIHRYYLLRAGEAELYTGSALTSKQCLRFLVSHCQTRKAIPVGFFFDYDVTMILADLPSDLLRSLYDRESRKRSDGTREWYEPVRWAGYDIEYLPHKEFKVRVPGGSWACVSDVSGFYQCSFLEALKSWEVGRSEWDRIEAGKLARSGFSENVSDETRLYNHTECDLLSELLDRLRAACRDAGYTLRRWQGAGSLASAILSRNDAPQRIKLKADIKQVAQAAYYGGRFELSMHGPYEGKIYEYDICSAYPHAMTLLPCLDHGVWLEDSESGPWSLRYVEWTVSDGRTWGPFPVRRNDGSIHYPYCGRGWYWNCEVQAAKQIAQVNVIKSWSFIPECDHRPYDFVRDIYEERQRIGKTHKGKILKLGMNSLYGKCAQSVGKAPYANAVYAGLITAITRARMAELCNLHDDAIVMIATDGIYATRPLGIEQASPKLGDWELATYDGMLFIQPGLYYSGDSAHSKTRTRGVPRAVVEKNICQFYEAWDLARWDGQVGFALTRFYGGRESLHLNRPDLHGQWRTVIRTVRYGANDGKRIPVPAVSGVWRSLPHLGSVDIESVPYRKDIGPSETVEAPDFIASELDMAEENVRDYTEGHHEPTHWN